MGRPLLEARLFVGSITKRTIIEWIKVFKIDGKHSLIDESDNESTVERDFAELNDTLEKLNLKFSIDYIYQENEFYIGRLIENVREDIKSDIWFWEQYNIKDVDIFPAMHSINCTSLEINLYDY